MTRTSLRSARLTASLPKLEPCVIQDERSPSYSGMTLGEIIVEEAAACGSGRCVAWRFQGRATCPEGGEPGDCVTLAGEPVTVSVEPQLPDRPAAAAMLCSCRSPLQ